MKIKTVVEDRPSAFDRAVNDWLSDGWVLRHTEVLNYKDGTFRYNALLVLPDPPAEVATPAPETIDPLDALRTIKGICAGMSSSDCETENCPLHEWCRDIPGRYSPGTWRIPGEEAAR